MIDILEERNPNFDKALILVEQHVKFKHPEAAEQSAKVCWFLYFSKIN